MNLDEAYRVLTIQGRKVRDLGDAAEYHTALGFLKGIIQGLLLQVPEEVQRKVEGKDDHLHNRIFALIDLVRKKDALASEMKAGALKFKGPVASSYVETTCNSLLALTESLGEVK